MFFCFLIHCVHMCCTYIYYNYCNPTTLKACFCIVFLNVYLFFHHYKQTWTVKKNLYLIRTILLSKIQASVFLTISHHQILAAQLVYLLYKTLICYADYYCQCKLTFSILFYLPPVFFLLLFKKS